MKSADLEYDLPQELIAQRPPERRGLSRLLVHERSGGQIRHRSFRELLDELAPETLVVVNDTRVIPARLRLRRNGGGDAEVLLLEHTGEDSVWEALARPSARLEPGQRLGPVELLERLGEGRWRLRLTGPPEGETSLPPYIHEPLDVERITLHVGLDTFRPVGVDDLSEHPLHGERYAVRAEAWERIRTAERVLAVGTTTVRVLESLARGAPLQGRTELFITPGFEFRRVNSLLTNFHLPRSSLLALVMAFAGVEETRRLYRIAIEECYRFYSFGDAMLIR